MAEEIDLRELAKVEEILSNSGHKDESELVRRAVDELDHLRSQIEKMKSELED